MLRLTKVEDFTALVLSDCRRAAALREEALSPLLADNRLDLASAALPGTTLSRDWLAKM